MPTKPSTVIAQAATVRLGDPKRTRLAAQPSGLPEQGPLGKLVAPQRGGLDNNLTFTSAPHNIQARQNRPPVKGYNFFTPVVHMQSGTVVGRAAGTRRAGQTAEEFLRNILDAHHYANIVEQVVSVTQSTDPASQLILPAPDGRRNWLSFRNASGGAAPNVYLGFGNTATANSVLKLADGDIFLFDSVVQQNDVYAWADGASAVLSFQYSHVDY